MVPPLRSTARGHLQFPPRSSPLVQDRLALQNFGISRVTLKRWSRWYKRLPSTSCLTDALRVLENTFRQAPSRRAFGSCRMGCYTVSPVREESLLTTILSILTSCDEGVQFNNAESITLRRADTLTSQTGVTISSWRDLALRTTALTPYL